MLSLDWKLPALIMCVLASLATLAAVYAPTPLPSLWPFALRVRPGAGMLRGPVRARTPAMQMAQDDGARPSGAAAVEPARFPTRATPPADVLTAQLAALRAGDMAAAFQLFSRARRLAIRDGARRDVREFNVKQEDVYVALALMLTQSCPGLIGHNSHEVLASVGDPSPTAGRLPQHRARVRVRSGPNNAARLFTITLTRQSGFDGGDKRDQDGFEHCWFVWTIHPDDGGGGGAVIERDQVPC